MKKVPATDAIFEQMHQVTAAADADPTVLRLSCDAKAPILLGRFSRGGLNRVTVKGLDHDFQGKPMTKVTPFGIYLPQTKELFLYFTHTKVTSDFIVDCLTDCWEQLKPRFPHVTTLLLNQDNGPENHSRRTQFIYRITQFCDRYRLAVQLAYYPPYHSKYNPIERVWGHLEQHWNGALLDALATLLAFAHSFRFHQQAPTVRFVFKLYATGARLSQKAMARLERRLQRLPGLEKWFVRIPPLNYLTTV